MLTKRYNRTAVYLTSLALLTCAAALAQENTGSILGTVTDQTGGVVPEAKIVATSPSVPRGIETVSDANGNYNLTRLPIGTYAVTVTKAGFNTVRQQNIEVQLGSQRTYNPKLTVGQVAEVIEVSATAIAIDTTSSRTSTNVSASEFDKLAKGRTFNSILAMAPGVRTEIKNGSVGVGGIQVDGASGSENAYIIDGVEVTDVRRGSLRAQSAIPLEFVQEVQVKSGGFEAEYGGATGGVVNVATRSGSNEFHGEAYWQWTGSGLNAGDRGYYQRSAADAAVAEFFRPKEDDYHIFYPGFRFAGPLVKDRLFFSTAFSPELEKTTRTINFVSGTTKTYEQKMKRYYGFGRVDYSPFTKLQINSSYIWSPQKIQGYLPNRDPRVTAPSNDLSIQGGYSPVQASTVSATWTVTPKLVIQGRYGYRYFNDKLATTGLSGNYGLSTAPYLIWANSSIGLPGVPAELQQANAYRNVSSTFGIQKDITTRNNVYLDGSYIVGKHTFKTGYQINRLSNDVLNDFTNGNFNIYWSQSFSRGSIQNASGPFGYYIWDDGVKNAGNVNSKNQGFYFQDAWRVSNRLSLNLGVRFENEFLPPFKAEVNGKKVSNPISFGWGSKIAPRLGAAWDVLGDGKWKLSGSFGQFYDQLKYELARGSFGSDYWVSHVYTLDKPASLLSLGKATPGAASNGNEIIAYDNRTLPINAQGEIEGIDPDIKPYKTQEFTINMEHALATRLVAAVRYTHKNLLRAIEDIGVLDGEDEVYLTGNPGFGETRDTKTPYGQKTPNGKEFLVPKAIRDYDAVEFRLQGQALKRLYMIGSYTWSRLYGNYSGAANSDESGRSDPGVSRAYDLPFYYFDATGSQTPSLGRLGTDRPHTFKFFGSYDVPWGRMGSTNFGLNQIAWSGTPDTTTIIYQSAPTLPYGRGDMGRTPVLTQTDLLVSHTVNFTESVKARFEANFINLFNQAAVISRTTQMNRSGAVSAAQLPLSQFFGGYDPKKFLSATGSATTIPNNPIYGLPGGNYRAGGGPGTTYSSAYSATFPNFGAYQDFRTIRLGVRFMF
jgi:outer membrane receptor protein involved in Fe transport